MTYEVTREQARRVLALPMQGNDAEAATIREYLVALLRQVWTEGEGFSGKRPFGNSGWDYDLYRALGKQGFIRMTLDEWGGVDDCDIAKGDELIELAIDALDAFAAAEVKP